MAGSSLLVLLDDIATVLDDVATMTKLAARKTAGVLGDDPVEALLEFVHVLHRALDIAGCALGAARNLAPRPIYLMCRFIVALSRTFPEVILAIFAVKLFGFGPALITPWGLRRSSQELLDVLQKGQERYLLESVRREQALLARTPAAEE